MYIFINLKYSFKSQAQIKDLPTISFFQTPSFSTNLPIAFASDSEFSNLHLTLYIQGIFFIFSLFL